MAQKRGYRFAGRVRPLFLHYENDAATNPHTLKYQYSLGQDLLVAPVHEQGRCDWTLYLPEDHWVNTWTGEAHHGGEIPPWMRPLASRRSSIARRASGLHSCFLRISMARPQGKLRQMEKNNESDPLFIQGNATPAA